MMVASTSLPMTALNSTAKPTAGTVWAAPAGARLTPQTPVTLTASNGTGQTYSLTYSIDDAYMITVKQAVSNAGTARRLLTGKEIEVLRHLAAGRANKEIADVLNISEHTVKVHFWRLFRRLGVNSRTQALHFARTNGWLGI